MEGSKKIRIGISIGDTNGIGLELVMKAFEDPRLLKYVTPIVYSSPKMNSFHRKYLNIKEFSFNNIERAEQADPKRINSVSVWKEEVAVEFGVPTQLSGAYAFRSLQAAVKDLKEKKIEALVTCPINKNNIQSKDFNFQGHTEYLQSVFNAKNNLMFLLGDQMRVGLVTNHLPVSSVSGALSKELIMEKLRLMNNSLKFDFGIDQPKIAVLALNPHGGDGGIIGREEIETIQPTIETAKEEGILAFGAFSPDGFFGSASYRNYDSILAMYHDQGLLPFKLLEFGSGVNYTAGISAIRTSPDHGTGYDIAGKGVAHVESFKRAIFMARDIYQQRKGRLELEVNAMKPIENN